MIKKSNGWTTKFVFVLCENIDNFLYGRTY